MKYEIQQYKGQAIFYDEFDDKFKCDVSIGDFAKPVKRASLEDVRKQIDQFVRDNLNFVPFKGIAKQRGDRLEVIEFSALRTDGKLIGISASGSKSFYGLAEIAKIYAYEPSIMAEKKEADIQFDSALKVRDEIYKELTTRLTVIDVAKYDLK